MTIYKKKSSNPIAGKDAAETFGESDVSLSHTDTEVSGESVSLKTNVGGAVTRTDDSSDISVSTKDGMIINPNVAMDGIRAVISGWTQNATKAYLMQDSDGAILDSTDVSGLVSGDSFDLYSSISSGTRYRVVLDAEGASWTRGYESVNNLPVSGTDLDIIEGWVEGNGANSYTMAVDDFQSLIHATSGDVTVEWPSPADIYRWDAATFQKTVDNETVDVYIDESADGGSTWTEIAGPISRGQDITANPSNECRFRVEISRVDTANNPTLDAIYRRWVV